MYVQNKRKKYCFQPTNQKKNTLQLDIQLLEKKKKFIHNIHNALHYKNKLIQLVKVNIIIFLWFGWLCQRAVALVVGINIYYYIVVFLVFQHFNSFTI
jgi:hypothetical protein